MKKILKRCVSKQESDRFIPLNLSSKFNKDVEVCIMTLSHRAEATCIALYKIT